MDLPANFPPGTRFWQLNVDAVADLMTGEFMLLDSSIATGDHADRLRQRIKEAGVEISQEKFRQIGAPSLAQQLKAMKERAERDPEFAKVLGLLISGNDEVEQMAWDALQNAPDPEDQRGGAKLLLKIIAKKQNVSDQ